MRRKSHRLQKFTKLLIAAAIILYILISYDFSADTNHPAEYASPHSATIYCNRPYIIDGDTFDCNGTRIRMHAIDAPEISECRPGRQCVGGNPYASKKYLISLTRTKIRCDIIELDHYGRSVGDCYAGDINLSCAMEAAGHAVERYGILNCP